VSLLSQDCTKVVGDYSRDDAVLVGGLFEVTNPTRDGPSLFAGVELAQDEITQSAGGILGAGGGRRPFVLIECDENAELLRAASYLVNTIGVHAMLGPTNSGQVTSVATGVTIPQGALLISPTATSPAITALETQGLLWRTSPSDALQAKALVQLVAAAEARIVAASSIRAGTVRVALVVKGDSYGTGLLDLILPDLVFNGQHALDQPNTFLSSQYANVDVTPNYDFSPLISQIAGFQPDIVILGGTSEVNQVIDGIDKVMPTPPSYLLSDGAVVPETLAEVAKDSGLRTRALFTIAGEFSTQAFSSFLGRFQTRYGVGLLNPKTAAPASDAAYLLAYAAAATASEPISGASLARGMRAITDPQGTPIALGPNYVNQAFAALSAGKTIKVSGASSPLDYNPGTGDPKENIDIQIMCSQSSGGLAFQSSGQYLDAVAGTLAGAVTPCQ
jgi:branched-chain amino acid transport system substrate-binding protein